MYAKAKDYTKKIGGYPLSTCSVINAAQEVDVVQSQLHLLQLMKVELRCCKVLFYGDGFEDILLRLDWYISTAFEKGFDLIMVSQTAKDGLPKIVWRQ